MALRRFFLAVAVAGLALAVGAPGAGAATRSRPRLQAFDSCRQLVDYAHRYAAKTAGTVGVPSRAVAVAPDVIAPPAASGAPGAPGAQAPDAVAAPAAPMPSSATETFSGTNVQETGIDEPDVVKTDGKHVFTVADGVLQVLDVTGDTPKIIGSLPVEGGFAHQLLLRGDRLLVLSTRYTGIGILPPQGAPVPMVAIAGGGGAETVLTEVDVRDPAAPRVARTMTLDGAFVDARQTGGTIRVVVDSTPAPVAVPLARAGLRTFVPTTTIRSRISGRTFRRSVVPCGDVRRPDVFSGLDLLTVLTIDLDRGLYSVDRDAIMAGAQTVYASDKSLYVASRGYVRGLADTGDVPDGMRTEIHRFDASQPGRTTYAASGTIPGFVVNQFALSEQDGVLRVASTDEPSWLPDPSGAQPPAPESAVTVLRQDGNRLVQAGRVGGLGKGQRIYAVRFLGDAGYVVTFRRVDPLYTLDLATPTAPRVAGELELSGYSAYLHPVGDGRLLGVGQDAGPQGATLGTQVSLFDVSDLAHPKRLANLVFGQGRSEAEFDHHAFLFWAPSGLAVLPLEDYEQNRSFIGAVGVHVTPGALSELGRVVNGSGDGVAPISRSLVVGSRLLTLSYRGLQASRLDTLAPLGFAAFPLSPAAAGTGTGSAGPGTTVTSPPAPAPAPSPSGPVATPGGGSGGPLTHRAAHGLGARIAGNTSGHGSRAGAVVRDRDP